MQLRDEASAARGRGAACAAATAVHTRAWSHVKAMRGAFQNDAGCQPLSGARDWLARRRRRRACGRALPTGAQGMAPSGRPASSRVGSVASGRAARASRQSGLPWLAGADAKFGCLVGGWNGCAPLTATTHSDDVSFAFCQHVGVISSSLCGSSRCESRLAKWCASPCWR